MPIGTNSPGGEGWAFPALFSISGAWALITETNLGNNFYGSHLQPIVDEGNYRNFNYPGFHIKTRFQTQNPFSKSKTMESGRPRENNGNF